MIISRAPYRISFFGGGTDYHTYYREFGGKVISTSIDKYCYIQLRERPPFFEKKNRIVWSKIEMVDNVENLEHPVVNAILRENEIDNIELLHLGDLPARSGLGSSSSFTCALTQAAYVLKKKFYDKKILANETIRIERDILNENVGQQDQVAVSFGGFNKIEFHTDDSFDVIKLPVIDKKLKALEKNILLFFTGVSRNATDIAKEQIKEMKKTSNIRSLDNMKDMVEEAEKILCFEKSNNINDFGKLLNESWTLKKSLSKSISNSKIDDIYDIGIKSGALGGKILGAGGGGFIIFYAPNEYHNKIIESLDQLVNVPFKFENEGANILYST